MGTGVTDGMNGATVAIADALVGASVTTAGAVEGAGGTGVLVNASVGGSVNGVQVTSPVTLTVVGEMKPCVPLLRRITYHAERVLRPTIGACSPRGKEPTVV